MFDKLKERDLKITMNLHPADGVRFFEDMYAEVAKYMGVDPASKAKIPFDCGSTRYMEAYFELIHHKYEEDGVDFWWIDWQQGKRSSIPGLDPLWALNHYHYIDNCRGGKRGLILSRYAEPGSQRYPVGFSGDTFIYWSCLRFQPYFTSTASNIGYTWWSHDIGGHQHGKKDDELYARWVQFGVFSPVNRLHSTSNEFMGKEPWKYGVAAREVAGRFLRLRRRLIPYLYTMNHRTYADMRALCEPMYYAYPNEEEAYCCKNEYLFGSELIAAPITSPENPKTSLAGVKVWLPRGTYIDMFTGRRYEGGRVIEMFRPLESFPLLAKEGAIIPLDMNETENGAYKSKAEIYFSFESTDLLREEISGSEYPLRYVFSEAKYKSSQNAANPDGVRGKSALFDGYSTCSDTCQTREYETMTVSVWVAPRAFDTRTDGKPIGILSCFDGSGGFELGIYNYGTWGFKAATDMGTFQVRCEESPVDLYCWNYLTAVFDGKNHKMSLYKNGEKVAESSLPGGKIFASAKALRVGGIYGGNGGTSTPGGSYTATIKAEYLGGGAEVSQEDLDQSSWSPSSAFMTGTSIGQAQVHNSGGDLTTGCQMPADPSGSILRDWYDDRSAPEWVLADVTTVNVNWTTWWKGYMYGGNGRYVQIS